MASIEDMKTNLGLPPVSQIGVVVKDMDNAVQYYSSMFGIGPFTIYEFVPENYWYMEKPSYMKFRMGKAVWGPIEWELLQPLEGKSFHQEFLKTHGEGLQHLGFIVEDYDEVFDRFLKAGFEPVMRAETYLETYKGYLKACYFDTHRVGGVLFEIIWKSWVMKNG